MRSSCMFDSMEHHDEYTNLSHKAKLNHLDIFCIEVGPPQGLPEIRLLGTLDALARENLLDFLERLDMLVMNGNPVTGNLVKLKIDGTHSGRPSMESNQYITDIFKKDVMDFVISLNDT